MHQTFYIDIDEEITSIVDRLRKAKAREIIIVVPKRALLIQSIVNLKLLKKEADNLRKQVIIVTQDKLGKLLVEKTGIAVEQKLDDIEGEEIAVTEERRPLAVEAENTVPEENNRERVVNIGSAEYFEEPAEAKDEFLSDAPANNFSIGGQKETEKITNKELVADIGDSIKSKRSFFGKSSSMDIVKNVDIRQKGEKDSRESQAGEKEKPGRYAERKASETFFEKEQRPVSNRPAKQADRVADFFSNNGAVENKRESSDYHRISLSGRFWKVFFWLGSGVFILALLAVAYLFLPKAEIKILAKTKVLSGDFQVKGDAAVNQADPANSAIPVKVVTVSSEVTGNFSATGNKSASSQKAGGTITIYNEYSNSPQPLVATTRFQTSDGKIFRLVRGAVVPGTSNISGETKPGAIEAEVKADQPGDAYNIDPTTFTIPGFQGNGNDKFAKIYAKSFKAMTGGKTSADVVATVTLTDTSNAKNSLAADIAKGAKQKLSEAAGAGAVILDDALNLGNVTYSFSNSEGEAVANFSGTAKASASALVFGQSDLSQTVINQLGKGASDVPLSAITPETLQLEFGKADADFTKNTLLIRVHASEKVANSIDLENLKKGILGKNEDDFKAYLKAYPQIESAEINYWPSFLGGKIPAYASRVTITLDNN